MFHVNLEVVIIINLKLHRFDGNYEEILKELLTSEVKSKINPYQYNN